MSDTLEFRHARPVKRSGKTLVMGILNCTPDSFSDGGRHSGPRVAAEAGLALLAAGADILDVGGESTRPGAEPVTADEEIGRIGETLALLRPRTDKPISVDTRHAATAEMALDRGADILNDITALRTVSPGGEWSDNGAMAAAAARRGAYVILSHMRGVPGTMQRDPEYGDVTAEVGEFLAARAAFAGECGIPPERIWLDPGFGFGKTFAHNAELLANLPALAGLGHVLVAGLSRKRMIADALGLPPDRRLEASLALAVMAAERGAGVIRAHDAGETAKAVGMLDAVRLAAPQGFSARSVSSARSLAVSGNQTSRRCGEPGFSQ